MAKELRRIIHQAYHGDESMAMLTQELLVYLAMCIQTEPHLFHGMLRLRIGLIIDVMAAEMQRSLKLTDHADATQDIAPLQWVWRRRKEPAGSPAVDRGGINNFTTT